MTAGYSGTPLVRKLGLKNGMQVVFSDMPASVRAEIEAAGLALDHSGAAPPDLVHVFATSREILGTMVQSARGQIAQNGMIWASWPKKASGVATDITEDAIREIAFPLGLVDVKVCAIDPVWSGLKLVIRKELRQPPA